MGHLVCLTANRINRTGMTMNGNAIEYDDFVLLGNAISTSFDTVLFCLRSNSINSKMINLNYLSHNKT